MQNRTLIFVSVAVRMYLSSCLVRGCEIGPTGVKTCREYQASGRVVGGSWKLESLGLSRQKWRTRSRALPLKVEIPETVGKAIHKDIYIASYQVML